MAKMLYGYDEDGNKIEATEGCVAYDAPPSDPDRVKLVPKTGLIKINHFAYPPSYNRNDRWKKEMSLFHKTWQDLFDKEYREFIFKDRNKIIHRADVFTEDNIVLEIQNSTISLREIGKRESFYWYGAENVSRLIWIFNVKNFGKISCTGGLPQFKPSKTVRDTPNSYFNIPGTRYLLKDLWNYSTFEADGKKIKFKPLDGFHSYIADRCLRFALYGKEPSKPHYSCLDGILEKSILNFHLYPDRTEVLEDMFLQAKRECESIKLFLDANEKHVFSFPSCLKKPLQYSKSYFRFLEEIKELELKVKDDPSINEMKNSFLY